MVTQSHRFHIDTGVRRNIAESVLRHLNVLTDHAVHDLLSELGPEVPPPLHRLLQASVRSNIRIFGELLQTGESMDRAKPSHAIAQFTRVLAQNRVPLHRLIFMYHCAHNSLERQLFPLIETVCRTHTGSPQASEFFVVLTTMRNITSRYITTMEQAVGRIYEDEAQRTSLPGDPQLLAHVQAIVKGDIAELPTDDSAVDYDLTGTHQAFIIWSHGADQLPADAVRKFASQVAQNYGSPSEPLTVFPEHTEAWCWIALDPERLPSGPPPIEFPARARLAIGTFDHGVEGFRLSHRRAMALHRLSATCPATAPSVLDATTTGATTAAAFVDRVDEASDIVISTLHSLAADDRYAEIIRETTRSVLLNGTSGASDNMSAHRNTIKYRLNKFKEAVGRDDISSPDFALALELAHWYGSRVLTTDDDRGND